MKFNVKAMQQFHYLRVFFFSVFSLGGAVRAIIGLLHADMHQRGTVGSVCHLATSVITVAPGMKGDEAVAKLTKRSKSGKVMQDVSSVSFGMTVLFLHCYILLTLVCFFFVGPQEEVFSIKEDLTVMVQSRPSHVGGRQNDAEEQEVQYNKDFIHSRHKEI